MASDPERSICTGWMSTGPPTPYVAGFNLRYFRAVPRCLTEFGGKEWIEVVHPTTTKPLDCVRITPRDTEVLASLDVG